MISLMSKLFSQNLIEKFNLKVDVMKIDIYVQFQPLKF